MFLPQRPSWVQRPRWIWGQTDPTPCFRPLSPVHCSLQGVRPETGSFWTFHHCKIFRAHSFFCLSNKFRNFSWSLFGFLLSIPRFILLESCSPKCAQSGQLDSLWNTILKFSEIRFNLEPRDAWILGKVNCIWGQTHLGRNASAICFSSLYVNSHKYPIALLCEWEIMCIP